MQKTLNVKFKRIPEEIKKYFAVDPSTKSGLRRISSVLSGKLHTTVVCTEDSPVSTVDSRGYYKVKFKSVKYSVARVIWFLTYGDDPIGYVIDHIDGNPSNNLINNLRKVQYEINAKNRRKHKNNSCNSSGVYFTTVGTSTVCRASWYDNQNKQKCKSFSVSKYGLLPAQSLAKAYRESILDSLQNYTTRHGKDTNEI